MENGNAFEITSKNNSLENVYISTSSLNGIPYTHSFLKSEDVQKCGTLNFEMSAKPNKDWASGKDDVPYSLSLEKDRIEKIKD